MKKIITLLLILQTSCSIYSNTPIQEYSEPNTISDNTNLSFSTLDLKPYKNDNKHNNVKTWFDYKLEKSQKIIINQIVLSGTNTRVDDSGTESIVPDYSGKDILISIKGNFDNDIIKSDKIMFQNEPDLLQISYMGEKLPRTKVLIDDSILLEIVSASKSEIKAKISTQAIPEYYLKGLHKLSILGEDEEHRTDALIRIGDPVDPKASLSPSIDEVKIIRVRDIYYDKEVKSFAFKVLSKDDDERDDNKFWEEIKNKALDTPIFIKLKGKNFMMFSRFSYSKIDSKLSYGHSTAISKDSNNNIIWESVIKISDIRDFISKSTHSISYSTPFGTAIRSF
jgi:hypothetical protein